MWQSLFLMQFFRVIEIQKVRAKHKIVSRYKEFIFTANEQALNSLFHHPIYT